MRLQYEDFFQLYLEENDILDVQLTREQRQIAETISQALYDKLIQSDSPLIWIH